MSCIVYLLLLKYVLDVGMKNIVIFNLAHMSYLYYRFGNKGLGTEKGPYVLVLSISFAWKK